MSITKMRRSMSKAIRPIMYGIAVIFVGSIFTVYLPQFRAPGATGQAGDVVAKVNGEGISRAAYERAVAISVRQLDMRAQLGNARPALREYHLARGQGFEAVVDSHLRAQAAEQEGVRVSRAEIQALIDEHIQLELDRLAEGATPEERERYERQLRQLADEENMRRGLLNERLTEQLRERFRPTEQDLMNSYNEVQVRHILVRTTNDADVNEARKKAEDLLTKLKGGADFAELAKEHSDDTNSKSTGGEVGWITATSGFVPEFTEAARGLKKGEISGIVETMFGYHILKVDDARTNVPEDIKDPEKKQEYMDTFSEQTIQNKTNAYFAKLRLKAEIEPIDSFLAGYIAENQAISAGGDNSPAEAQKLIAEAIKHYEAAAARNDLAAGPALHWKLVELYNQTKQDDKALAAMAKALEGSPSAEMFITQGEIYQRKEDKAKAIEAYEEAFKLADSQPWLFVQLQGKFKELEREDLAKKAYDKWDEFKAKGGQDGQFATSGSMPPIPFPLDD